MNHSPSRRRLANLIIDPKALARLSLPFLLMALASVGLIVALRSQVLSALQATQLHGVENLPAMNALLELQRQVTELAIWGACAIVLLSLALWIVYSHRYFGPKVALRRHIQKLCEGDYSSRVTPRAGDELKDLADDLNSLAQNLQTRR